MERTTLDLVGTVSLDAQAPVLAACGGEATVLSVLVDGIDDPVDSGIIADGDVVRVHQDDLKVLKGGILVHPVRVQHTHVTSEASDTVLGNRAQVALELQVVDTSVDRFAVHYPTVVRSLATSAANGDAVDGVTLLGLVAELVCLVGTCRVGKLDNLLALAVLPGSVVERSQGQRKSKIKMRSVHVKLKSECLALLKNECFMQQ